MNRGSEAEEGGGGAIQGASMRPRFMNRGSPPPPLALNPHPRRFNEAPIHESGKSEPRGWNAKRPSSFNEAPIHESGK